MATYKLAVIVKRSISSDHFLVIKQTSPPVPDVEYEQFVNYDLWDLPSIEIKSGDEEKERSDILISGADSVSDKINLSSFSVGLAINQEYPPGVMIMPMKSRTQAPFHTTNLIVIVPQSDNICIREENCIAYADALLLDPGCCTESHSKLADLVAALPRKLVVFVTHHHHDHTDD